MKRIFPFFFLYDKDDIWLNDLSKLECKSYFRKKNGRTESCQAPELEDDPHNIFPEFCGYALFKTTPIHAIRKTSPYLSK